MDFCIVTPSYAADFERCALLARSLSFVSPPLTHYIIVGRRDLKLFEKLRGRNTEIVAEADILPLRLWKIGSFRNKSVLLSWQTLPVRGWLLQQLLKIAVARHVSEDVILYVDSDVAFIRPFDSRTLLRDGRLMLYRVPNAIRFDMSPQREWVRTAHDLFGLPAPTFPSNSYINSLVAWRRENVLRLCDALEANRNAPWARTLANSWHCSEYILYGVFCERLLEERAGHFCESRNFCHNYWRRVPLSDEQLRDFFAGIRPEHVAVMLSAKAGMPVARYERLVEEVDRAAGAA